MRPVLHNRRCARFGLIRLPALLVLLCLVVGSSAFATNAPVSNPTVAENTSSPELMRAYLQLQEQLHSAQLAIERNRQEAEIAAAKNAETIASRLKTLEEALVAQSALQRNTVETVQTTNRLITIVAGSCAAVGFLAVLLAAYFQWRTVNQLTEFSLLTQASLTAGRAAMGNLTNAQPLVTTNTEQANTRMLGALERLEKQILELENKTRAPLPEGPLKEVSNGGGGNSDHDKRIHLLLAKGESLLSLDKAEEALACYDEILGIHPEHSEALVKKGDALERLRKIDDAIDCYDRAIAAGGSLTVAYLHKGGLYNRLERYEEALQCYEQALRTQEKSHAV